MKKLVSILGLFIIGNVSYAQSPEYDDLKILYADANYEKLVRVAESYTTKDDTKKDVMPYIWMAKGLYKISLSGTDDDKFKNAYKDAIKFLGKGMGYDAKYNENENVKNESDFIDQFQASLQEIIENEVATEAYKKAFGWTIKYQKITIQPCGPFYMLGACMFLDGDKAGARTKWQEGEEALKEISSIADWSEADKKFLKMGIITSAKALVKGRQKDAAKELMNKVAHWFENDEDWKSRYDEVMNM